MLMKANVYSLDGKTEKQVDLPEIFHEQIRPDLINRASIALRSQSFQPKGVFWRAGLQTSAEYVGRRRAYRSMMNIGRARIPKIKIPKGRMGEARIVPLARKGRRAHPTKPEKILVERINRKERRKAIRSAIAATAVVDLVKKRGHKVDNIKVPIIVDDSFESLKKTKEVIAFFNKLGLEKELERGSVKSIKPGKGPMRGRKYRRKRSVLVLVSKNSGVLKASRNIPGVDASLAKNVNVDLLAPGGTPGRLTIYTESALKELEKTFKV